MKKYLVSSLVVVSFIAYSVYQRIFGGQTNPVIVPKNILMAPASTQTNAESFSSLILPSFAPTPQSIASPTPTAVPPKPKATPVPVPRQNIPTPTQTQTSAPTPTPTMIPTPTPTPTPSSGYKDGTYTGDPADAYYGIIQVQATIANGRLTNIQFLQYPNDRSRSIAINQQADPILAQEAIQAQSAQVDLVSGATDSSQAFIQSLQTALNKAKS